MEEEKALEELKIAYSNLSLDDKRNEFNKEIMALSLIINSYLGKYNSKNFKMPKNYAKVEGAKLSEDDVMVQNYLDLLEIKNQLILLLKYQDSNK